MQFVLSALAFIFFLFVGGWQSVATTAYFQYLGWTGSFADITGSILGYFPFVGSIGGMLGLVYVWHWEWWATLLMLVPFWLLSVLGVALLQVLFLLVWPVSVCIFWFVVRLWQ